MVNPTHMHSVDRSFHLLWIASVVALSVARPNKNIAATNQYVFDSADENIPEM